MAYSGSGGVAVRRQAANFAVMLKQTTFKRILSRCRATTPAATAQNIELMMQQYPQLDKILKKSTYYGDGTYLPLMRLVALI